METSRLRKFWIHGEATAAVAVVRLAPFFGLKCFPKHSGLLTACVTHGDRGGEQRQRHFPASPSLVGAVHNLVLVNGFGLLRGWGREVRSVSEG